MNVSIVSKGEYPKGTRFAVITGNSVDGFECYGMFGNVLDAVAWAENDGDLPDVWHVMPIYAVEQVESEVAIKKAEGL